MLNQLSHKIYRLVPRVGTSQWGGENGDTDTSDRTWLHAPQVLAQHMLGPMGAIVSTFPNLLVGVTEGRVLVLEFKAAETTIPSHHHPPGSVWPVSRLAVLAPPPLSPLRGLFFGHAGRIHCTTCIKFPSQCLNGSSQFWRLCSF